MTRKEFNCRVNANIKRMLKARNMGYKEICSKVGLSESNFTNKINKDSGFTCYEVFSIAKILDVRPDILCGWRSVC